MGSVSFTSGLKGPCVPKRVDLVFRRVSDWTGGENDTENGGT